MMKILTKNVKAVLLTVLCLVMLVSSFVATMLVVNKTHAADSSISANFNGATIGDFVNEEYVNLTATPSVIGEITTTIANSPTDAGEGADKALKLEHSLKETPGTVVEGKIQLKTANGLTYSEMDAKATFSFDIYNPSTANGGMMLNDYFWLNLSGSNSTETITLFARAAGLHVGKDYNGKPSGWYKTSIAVHDKWCTFEIAVDYSTYTYNLSYTLDSTKVVLANNVYCPTSWKTNGSKISNYDLIIGFPSYKGTAGMEEGTKRCVYLDNISFVILSK